MVPGSISQLDSFHRRAFIFVISQHPALVLSASAIKNSNHLVCVCILHVLHPFGSQEIDPSQKLMHSFKPDTKLSKSKSCSILDQFVIKKSSYAAFCSSKWWACSFPTHLFMLVFCTTALKAFSVTFNAEHPPHLWGLWTISMPVGVDYSAGVKVIYHVHVMPITCINSAWQHDEILISSLNGTEIAYLTASEW